MYRVEIFDEKMDFVSACYTDDAQTISIDYLAYDPFQITTQIIEAKKGYFAHITKEMQTVADCIISDVQPDKNTQELSLRPLQALFDVNVFYSAVSDAITWIADNLSAQYVTNADLLQRRPLNITATVGSRLFPLTGYNLNPTINILSVITNAFATWGVVTEAFLDLSNKEIVVNIFEQVAQQTIECDLDNIISAEITLGDSYGSTNKLTIKKTVAEGTPSGTTEITYYRHTDGSINTTDDDRIVPVFWDVTTIEQTEDMTDAQWIAETFTKAKEVLSVGQYDNEVILSVWEDDKIVNPTEIEIGTIVTLLLKGETYYSILTGYQVEGNIITLTFGAVRTELTKKLSIQNRGNTTSSVSSGGGGGGGGGDVTGVKGDAEVTYRTGNVNITKADIGLGNVDNTSDLNKPISTATQTALNNKVDVTAIATTSDLGLVMPDGTSITVDADGTIHAVGGGGGGEGGGTAIVELWTNPSPTSSFSAQTVSVNLSTYSGVYITFRVTASTASYAFVYALVDGLTYRATCGMTGSSTVLVREATVDTTGVTFTTGYSGGSASTGHLIPYKIYGIGSSGNSSISYFTNRTVSVASNAEILRITDPKITTATVVLECTFANPSAISGTVSWTSYDGYISFVGTCTSSTTANVTLNGASFNELHPIGSVICKSTNVNPSADYGGTWELIDKQFKYKWISTAESSQYFTPSSGTTVETCAISLHEHFISILRFSFNQTSAIGDTTITIGLFDLSALGVNGGSQNLVRYILASSDGGNGIAMMDLTTAGTLRTLDRVTVTSGGTITAGQNIHFSVDIPLTMSDMDDSFCDKFFFKRTA